LVFILLSSALSQTFLPTEYASVLPYQFDIQRRTFSLEMALCDAQVYAGCTMTAYLNLPFTRWSVPDGTYANYSIYGEGDNCGLAACTNNPASPDPFACVFAFNPRLGTKLYAVGVAGNAGGFQATFNMKIVCPANNPGKARVFDVPASPTVNSAGCPANPDLTRRLINLNVDGDVITSPRTEDSKKYSLVVCPDRASFSAVYFTLQSTDRFSATASYFCSSSDCNTNNSPTGWYDDSGTALNAVTITNLNKAQMLWFNIYGWGQYQGLNRFVFNVRIVDQS